ncbi:MAG TPA: asparagine synthase (glutamine-hydrolyzing) [Gemmatimonadaceae bacterium]|nr:asparagine synthase (glutamine-hydrolyzing) [Gemmatimonadaceae bacterium]
MCGVTGLLTNRATDAATLATQVRRMMDPIAHRGPDDEGIWVRPEAGVALGFRRLAILDVSELGHQPMSSGSGRFTIVFNGEIYNYRELRRELEQGGARFRGTSDTEVILAAFERWGVGNTVRRFAGMFAIAVWDERERALTLIRDRLGIKPLFVYSKHGLVTFGSELKALVAGPEFDRDVDVDSVAQYLRYLYVPAPHTIYRHVVKLMPGTMLTIRDAGAALPEPEPFWSIADVAESGLTQPVPGARDEALNELEALLTRSIDQHMIADVPLGALLSGGVDSSTVVALMQRASSRPVKTFSVAFDSRVHNEAPQAARVASFLGTDHTEVLVTGQEALSVVPRLPEMFDEPHADTAQIPAYLICGVARQQVTVALSGDGGDELFGGYNRYVHGERMLERAGRVPRVARRAVAASIGALSAENWDHAHGMVAPLLPRGLRHRLPGDKLHKVGRLLRSESVAGMYKSLVSAWQDPEVVVDGTNGREDPVEHALLAARPVRLLDRMMLADQQTYLPDDQLAKMDRVSMAVSLELRVPFLDHRVAEYSWRLPASLKVRDGTGKYLLKELLYRLVPRELVERPKQGFSVPIEGWLRGPLREWAEELLHPSALARDGLLVAGPIREQWSALKAGRSEGALATWSVLMLQAWRERWAA